MAIFIYLLYCSFTLYSRVFQAHNNVVHSPEAPILQREEHRQYKRKTPLGQFAGWCHTCSHGSQYDLVSHWSEAIDLLCCAGTLTKWPQGPAI